MKGKADEKISVLIVGAGRIAGLNENDTYREKPCTHAGAYREHQGFKLLGVVDQNEDAGYIFGEQFGIPSYPNLETALEEVKPDHVSVAVPYQFHSKVVLACATSGNKPRSIFCEKPISDSLESAEAMVENCKKNNVRLFVNNRRLLPVYQLLKKTILEDFNGEMITFNACCSSGLHAIGLHMLDLIRFICGDAAWVSAVGEPGYVEKLPYSSNYVSNDQRVKGLIGFKNGIVGVFANTALIDFTYFELEVICKNGKVRVSDNGQLLEVWKTRKPSASTLSYRLDTPEINYPQKKPLFSEIAESLYKSVREKWETIGQHPLSAGNGLESYRLLSKLIQSSNKEGNKITF